MKLKYYLETAKKLNIKLNGLAIRYTTFVEDKTTNIIARIADNGYILAQNSTNFKISTSFTMRGV
jgi:hypothetical protein